MKKYVKTAVSLVLIAALVFGMAIIDVPGIRTAMAASAQAADGERGTAGIDGSPVSITSRGTLGAMLASEVQGVTDKQTANNGCNIFSVEVSGKTAKIEYETLYDAEAIVAIYEEDGVKMLASGHCAVAKGSTAASVTIEAGSMPAYFLVRAFLVEPESFRPLCTVYESPMYTKNMQEIIKAKASDYDSARVLNLDGRDDTNFVVFGEDTILIPRGKHNKVTKADDKNGLYVIEDADSSITSLKKGDTFSYMYDDENIIIVKISSISKSGTTVTIRGEDISMEDVFELVKVESESGLEKCEFDSSRMDKGVKYKGLAKKNSNVQKQQETAPVQQAINIDDDETPPELSFELDYQAAEGGSGEEVSGVGTSVEIKGELTLSFTTSIKIYLSHDEKYVEGSIGYTLSGDVSITGEIRTTINLGSLALTPVPGLLILLAPGFVIEVDGEFSIGFTLSGSVGARITPKGVQDISKSPQFESEIKAEVTVFVGISLIPQILFLSDKIVYLDMDAKAGAEAESALYSSQDDDSQEDEKHLCEKCIQGELFFRSELTVNTQLLDNDKLKFSVGFPCPEKKLSDFYWSFDFNDHAFTKCPHKQYKVTVYVRDENGNNIKGASVKAGGQTLTTNDKGYAELYLPEGKYTASAEYGKSKGSEKFEVKKAVKINIVLINSGGNISFVSLGGQHSAAITKDGSLYLWGDNQYGQIGDGTKKNKTKPVKIMDNVASVSLGDYHSAAITKDGSLYMWGYNWAGQLGDGTKVDKRTPVKIMDNIAFVSLGNLHSAAITIDGDLYLWGYNDYGQLGDGTYEIKYKPVKVMSNVASVSLGGLRSAAITKAGSLYLWGYNWDGQLGDGTTEDKYTPMKIMDNVASVSLGSEHSAAITKDGSLYLWGSNWAGQIGNGTVDESQFKPVKIMNNVVSMSLGFHSAAITKDGDLYLWGYNEAGQLGDGTTEDKSKPIKIMDNVASVSLGSGHSAAITKDGSLYLWGENDYGQLGDGTKVNKKTPTQLKLPESGSTQKLPAIEGFPVQQAGKTAAFSALSAGGIYNYYLMADRNSGDPFSAGNLLYIAQGIADSSGRLSFDYSPKKEVSGASGFVVGMFSDYVPGDINGDGETDTRDLTRMMKYLSGESVEINNSWCLDVNADGDIDSRDLVRLMKHLSDPENAAIS